MTTQELSLPPIDDFHHHLRDGEMMSHILPIVAAKFRRVVVVPNLVPPITTVDEARAYRDRILTHTSSVYPEFTPLMTLYLTDRTTVADIRQAHDCDFIIGVKMYPAGATTNSHYGVTSVENLFPVFETMAEVGLPLLVHGEVTAADVDIFDREEEFLKTVLLPLIQRFPTLKVVLEHITTSQAVDFILSTPSNIAATITPHHLLYNRNALFHGGICPHMYCLPILKSEQHRQALLQAIASGNPKFFIGTDSAPHIKEKKESNCGCAGIFNAHIAIELYIEAFESVNALDKLEDFLCVNGQKFYGLLSANSSSQERKTYIKESQQVPERYQFSNHISIVPLRAGGTTSWRLKQ